MLGSSDDLVVHASIRSRAEAITGQFRPGAAKSDFLQSFRTILSVEYGKGPVTIGGELRDARGYGERRNSSVSVNEVNALEPVQAYVRIKLPELVSGDQSALTAGRFTFESGAGRLIGKADFVNSVNSFTGARADWRDRAGDKVLLFWTMPSARLPDTTEDLRDNHVEFDRARTATQFFGGDVITPRLGAGIATQVYAYRLSERDSDHQQTRNRHLFTAGARLFRAPAAGKYDFDVEAAHQTGRTHGSAAASDRTVLDVDAGFAHAEVGRSFAGGWAPRLSLHGDYASGDDPATARYTRFDTLFGAARADYGPSGLYGAVNRANLLSAGARVDLQPSKRTNGFLMARALWLDELRDSFAKTGVRDRSGEAGRYVGTQIEGRVRRWLVPKRLRVEGGGAYLVKGAFMHDAPNAPATGDTLYTYLDLVAEF